MSGVRTTKTPDPGADSFEHDAIPVLAAVREAVAGVLASIPAPVSRAYHLVARLGIDRALAWRVWQVGYGEGSLPDPAHIPGKVGVQRFLDAAGKAGADSRSVRAARDAFDRLDRLPSSYGADRASINVLLASLGERSRKPVAVDVRRDLFRAQCQILGVQARALHQVSVVVGGSASFAPDVILLRSIFGLHRTRPGVSWVLGRSRLVQTAGPHANYIREPLDTKQRQQSGPPLMPALCSSPIPRVTRHLIDDATYEDCLEPGPIGPQDALDIVMGERISQIPRDVDDHDAVTMRATTPAERLCLDLLLHRSAVTPDTPTVRMFTMVHGEVSFHANIRGELANSDELIEVMHQSAPPVEGIPSAGELIRQAIAATGQPRAEFRHYRLMMKYPPIPVIVAVEYGLADAGTLGTAPARPRRKVRARRVE